MFDFVFDDFMEESYREKPAPQTVENLAPYVPEFLQDCVRSGRSVPEGFTVEEYVSIWNQLCSRSA